MLKKHMAACLIATAFVAAPALAQTTPSSPTDRPTASGTGTTASGSPAMQPAPTGGAMAPATPATPAAPAPSTMSSSPAPAPNAGSSAATAPATPPAMPPATPPSTMAQGGGTQGAMQGQFMTQLQDQQVMASRLIGTTVVSANNESIGDVNDVILDRQGQVTGVVIGVGGFLGIGEKDVAVAFKALEFTASTNQGAMTSNNTGAGARPATTGSTTATTGSAGTAAGNEQQNTATNRQTATTGNTGNAGAGGAAQANSNNDGGVPDRIMLRMTKAELQAAPTFQTSRRGSGNNAGGNNAPKQ